MISKSWLNEPLFHFALLGLALFALYGFLNSKSNYAADEIVIDQARVTTIAAEYEKTWQRPPTDEELQTLIDSWIREEIFYREGIRMGFDRDDPVIRRRIAQKVSFVADGLVPETPDDAELEAWLLANIDDYQIPAVYSLRQVYVDPQRHKSDLDDVLNSLRASLDASDAGNVHGDPTSLPEETKQATSIAIGRVFGTDFVDALERAPVGSWQGPIRSGYGLHFVKIDEFIEARNAELEEVRSALERDVLRDKSQKINDAFYVALRERYTVRTEPAKIND